MAFMGLSTNMMGSSFSFARLARLGILQKWCHSFETYMQQGDYARSLEYNEKALAIRLQVLGQCPNKTC